MSEVLERNDEASDLIADLPVSIDSEVVLEDESIADLDLRYGFKSGGYGLLIPEASESEVINSPNIFSIPNTSDLMIGLVSVRGHFSPVFDLGKMLGLELKSHQKSIIVLKINGDYLAFPLDTAHSLELPASVADNHPQLPDALVGFAGDIYQIGEDFWIEFDFKRCIEQFANKISQ
ncbi:MAG: chemotaxis protein CheW [Methylococcales bacterium]